LLTTVGATPTSYSDTTVAHSTTYTYTVSAIDAADNESPQGDPASATTQTPPQTLTFTPTADTFVQSDLAGTNFGSATSVQVDNNPTKHFLLKFAVSGIGGRTVVRARLRLWCVDSSNYGGAFHRVANTSWSEQTVTWNTAPPGDAAVLGSLGAVARNTWYEVDVTPLVTGDGAVSLRTTSTSKNGADFSSKEGVAPPQLVVTVG
ncbi:MAG: DNRLRE domain-containing protein, partial [Actinomycetota bacterium]